MTLHQSSDVPTVNRRTSGPYRRGCKGALGIALALNLVAPVLSTAQPADPSGFAFLRVEPSARAAALGGSFAAIADGDINAFFFNPALTDESVDGALSLSYLNHVTDINAGFLAYGRNVPSVGVISAGVRYMNWGTLEGATETGERTGSFRAGDIALTVGASRLVVDRVRAGVNLHVVHSSIADFGATAVAGDAGIAFSDPASRVTVSASVNNLGGALSSLGETNDDLPVDIRLGLSKRFANLPLLVSVTGYNLHDFDAVRDDATVADNIFHHVAVGGEFQFSPAFNLRFGYNHRRHDELKSKSRLDFAGVGVGVGLRVRGFKFDYGYSSWSELGGLNQLTVGTIL